MTKLFEHKPRMQMKIHDPEFDWLEACPLCGGADFRLWEASASGYSVQNLRVRCAACGLVFSNPQASSRRLDEFYTKVYFKLDEFKGGYFSQESGRVQRQKAAEELKLLESLGAKGRILDVGCAAGYFLEAARERGWKAEGSELSPSAAGAARAKKFKVHVGAAEALRLRPRYDVVHAAHTLEHVKDPLAFLLKLKSFLAPGGRLMIEVPNVYQLWSVIWRWQAFLKGRFPPLKHAKEHTFDFSMATLLAFIAKAGLRAEHAECYEDPQGLLRLLSKPDDSPAKKALRPLWVAFAGLARLKNRFGNYLQVVAKA
jgi:2-polyprenyl-3-methyl-5-hydroxy-6-metoxy-1,4-benzoquinol methylase